MLLTNSDLPTKDGIDHLNIYSRASTELGRFLTNPTLLNFDLIFNGFNVLSIEHLWFFLKTKDERILSLKSPWYIKPFIKTNKIEV